MLDEITIESPEVAFSSLFWQGESSCVCIMAVKIDAIIFSTLYFPLIS